MIRPSAESVCGLGSRLRAEVRKLERGPEPTKISEYRDGCREDPDCDNWDVIDARAKIAVREALHDVQKACCAYCGVVIPVDSLIEHIHPRNESSWGAECDRALHAQELVEVVRPQIAWNNLLLCCTGNVSGESLRTGRHCDKAKEGEHRCELPFPDDPSLPSEILLEVDGDGCVFPSRDLPQDVQTRLRRLIGDADAQLNTSEYRGLLNLNSAQLVVARQQYADALAATRTNPSAERGAASEFPWMKAVRT